MDNDIVIMEDKVGKRHCVIELEGGKYFLTNHASGGTYVNSIPI